MEDVPLCPPYISELIWNLLHPHPHPNEQFARYNEVFVNLSIYALSHQLTDQAQAQQIRDLTKKSLNGSVQALR